MLAKEEIPKKTTGTRTNKATNKDKIKPGVKSWYLLRIPPAGAAALLGDALLEGAINSRAGPPSSKSCRDWSRGFHPASTIRCLLNVPVILSKSEESRASMRMLANVSYFLEISIHTLLDHELFARI